jgi:hypothetical protein
MYTLCLWSLYVTLLLGSLFACIVGLWEEHIDGTCKFRVDTSTNVYKCIQNWLPGFLHQTLSFWSCAGDGLNVITAMCRQDWFWHILWLGISDLTYSICTKRLENVGFALYIGEKIAWFHAFPWSLFVCDVVCTWLQDLVEHWDLRSHSCYSFGGSCDSCQPCWFTLENLGMKHEYVVL